MGLILSRKVGEGVTLIIPPSTETREVHVTVDRVSYRKQKVTTKYEAPQDIKILRDELLATPPTDVEKAETEQRVDARKDEGADASQSAAAA